MPAFDYEIGFAELALVEVAGGTFVSETTAASAAASVVALASQAVSTSVANSGDATSTSTLLGQTLTLASMAAAGSATGSLVGLTIGTTQAFATGVAVLTAQGAIVASVDLNSAGSSVGLFEAIGDPIFQSISSSTTSFVGQSVFSSTLSAPSTISTSFNGTGIRLSTFAHTGSASTTVLGSAYIQLDLGEALGSSATAFEAQSVFACAYALSAQSTASFVRQSVIPSIFGAVGSGQSSLETNSAEVISPSFDIVGSALSSLNAVLVQDGNLATVGQSTPDFVGNAFAFTDASMIGQAVANLELAATFSLLPLAGDYVIREYELRGVIRPEENRIALYN